MADLYKHDVSDRESWIKWAREFVRRGLWPGDYITVHGPHPYPFDLHWGEADCELDDDSGSLVKVGFTGRHPCRGKYAVHNVTMWTEDLGREKVTFPLLKTAELSPRARRWLKVADRVIKYLADERRRINREANEIWRKIHDQEKRRLDLRKGGDEEC